MLGCAALAATVAVEPAFARGQLGPYGNALIVNPHAVPAAFGTHVASGDFNDDGIDDLAIAESFGTRVRVHLGSPWTVGDGLAPIAAAGLTVATPSHNGEMATGDFDDDGRDELVLGAAGANNAAGAVYGDESAREDREERHPDRCIHEGLHVCAGKGTRASAGSRSR